MILILLLTVPFPTSFHFSFFNGFAPVELYVNANKREEQETTLKPRKAKLQSLVGYFSVSEQSGDNFESISISFVQLEMFISISSCFPSSQEFTIPEFFAREDFRM